MPHQGPAADPDPQSLAKAIGSLPRDASGYVRIPSLMPIVRSLRGNHRLALQLWATGSRDARAAAVRAVDPMLVDEGLLERWVGELEDWRTTDAFAAYVARPSPFGLAKAFEWADRPELYVRRAGFATIAQTAWQRNDVPDRVFIAFLPLIRSAADDARPHVRKAVNWALRAIGRRNAQLSTVALTLARDLQDSEDGTARWVGSHRFRELCR